MRFGKIAILHQRSCQFTSSKREAWVVGGCPLRGGEASLRSNLMKHFRHQATGWSNGVVPTFLHFGQLQRTGISSAPGSGSLGSHRRLLILDRQAAAQPGRCSGRPLWP